MALSKDQEMEIFSTYNAYWDNYSKGNVEGTASLLAEEYTQVGSAESEVFTNKRDAVKFLHDTIDQVTGKLEMRNRQSTLESLDDLVIIHERCDLYVLADEVWEFYGKFRATTLMQERRDGWKIIHQHQSIPDARTGEGENIATEKIAAENLQLKEAVKRQTIALQQGNRELKIEAALERVRSRAMAMQQSAELGQLIETVYREMGGLDFKLQRCFIMVFDRSNDGFTWWMASDEIGASQRGYHIPYSDHAPQLAYVRGWKERNERWSFHLYGEVKRRWDEYLFNDTELKQLPGQSIAVMRASQDVHLYSSFSNFGCISAGTVEPLEGDYFDILVRFAKVFDQTYTRFNDLKQAEAQAHEARIEAALERVRGRAMAMHSSDELREVVAVIFEQLQQLDFGLYQLGILIFNDSMTEITWWSAGRSQIVLPKSYHIPVPDHPLTNMVREGIRNGNDYLVFEVEGDMKKQWDHFLFHETELKHMPDAVKKEMQSGETVTLSQAFITNGVLDAAGPAPLPDDKADILKRFARVLDLAYTRVEDLQKAEARTKEAIQSASLDRVRAEIASMRTAADLNRITPLVWRELVTLGVPFFRCGVFIIHEADEQVHVYLSTPEGSPLGALHLDFNSSETTRNAIDSWRMQRVYTTHWDREQFREWVQSLIGQGQLQEATTYQAGDQPPESLTLQFVPFSQGMLYVGSVDPLKEDQLHLVKSLARAFSVAYARYEDFRQLEDAKKHVEETLSELKATQAQLVQREKMASLGELTAGIAHEIQNPLNFVNNFSDLNQELLDELKAEILKGDLKEAGMIADNVRENEFKINLHGKRADAIVKGMLQHSRASAGQKELADINALVDEYLRLAFHGLRAKDKAFNATIETDLDPLIGKVNIIPPDIGRVLLNLYNNAFFAVNERKKAAGPGYMPTVSVSTRKSGDAIEIRVADNGMGIPEKIKDKIFQPFFTTKPTGQGTGLGLSLSYDVVKAHGGHMEVHSVPGEGTEFRILLPV